MTAEIEALCRELGSVNQLLWDIEDKLRHCEHQQRFDAEFIELARSVYHTNDRRAAVKRRLNELTGSDIIEEKSYYEHWQLHSPGATLRTMQAGDLQKSEPR